MKCNDARPLLDLLGDGMLEPKDCALVLDHLQSCAECQSEWNSLEQLHNRFHEAREKLQAPTGMMDKISQALKEAEASEPRPFQRYARPLPFLAIAATAAALIGFIIFPWLQAVENRSTSSQSASADTLMDDLASAGSVQPLTDRSALSDKLGYEPKYLPLSSWQLDKFGVTRVSNAPAIARFDFVRKDRASSDHLTCYQAQQGVIQASTGQSRLIGNKRVLFGNRGNLQFALWSQSGRDYLFVTALPTQALEEIVRGT
jgi:anti-sigma factor RsiW